MSQQATIGQLLKQATFQLENVSATPGLDAQVLLAHCIERDRTYLYTWPERSPTPEQTARFNKLIQRRAEQIPLAHLTGTREFWSMEFKVTPDTLVPRPDTELIVELALNCLEQSPGPVLDLGTGTGVIAICIASERPDIRVDAVDVSAAALEVAQQNAATHQVDVNFFQSDWFNQVNQNDYRLIVSNPPYLSPADKHLTADGLQFEPEMALIADEEGLAAIKNIVCHAADYTTDNATMMIEHGHKQGPDVRQLMQQQGFREVTTHRDIESRERVTLGKLPK